MLIVVRLWLPMTIGKGMLYMCMGTFLVEYYMYIPVHVCLSILHVQCTCIHVYYVHIHI